MDEEWQPRSPRRDARLLAWLYLTSGLVIGLVGLVKTDGSLRWVWVVGMPLSVLTAWRWFQQANKE